MPYPLQEGGTWLLRCEAVGQNLPYGLGSCPAGPGPGPVLRLHKRIVGGPVNTHRPFIPIPLRTFFFC